MKKITIISLLLLATVSLFAQVPHFVSTVVLNNDGSIPNLADISFEATIDNAASAGVVLTENSGGCQLYEWSGYIRINVQCATFPQWDAGDVVTIDAFHTNGATGTEDVTLTYGSTDWGTGITLSAVGPTNPDPADVVAPLDGAPDVAITTNLEWEYNGTVVPDGYKLFFGTDNPPTNIVNGDDLGDVLLYDPDPDLLYNQTYFWQIVPFTNDREMAARSERARSTNSENTRGDAQNCPVWSFQTEAEPVVGPDVWATLVAPADGNVIPPEGVMLDWDYTGSVVPDGFEVWVDDSNLGDVIGATEYDLGDLAVATSVTWKIMPYVEDGSDMRSTAADLKKSTKNEMTRERLYPAGTAPEWTFSTWDPEPPAAPAIPAGGGSTTINGGTGTGGAGTTVTMTPTGAAPTDVINVEQIDPATTTVPLPNNAFDLAFDINTTGTITDPITILIEWDYPVPTPPTSGDPVLVVTHDGGISWDYHIVDAWDYSGAPYWIEFTTDVLSHWVVGSGDDDPLPVTLTSFTAAYLQNEFVNVQWVSASETAMQQYILYRSEAENGQQIQIHAENATNSTTGDTYTYSDYEVETGNTYYYWLEAVSNDGTIQNYGPTSITVEGDPIPELPQTTVLEGNFPNPFNPETVIKFDVKEGETAKLTIYNIKGAVVEEGTFDSGVHEYEWNAKVGSGVYFYKLSTESYTETKKMLLLK